MDEKKTILFHGGQIEPETSVKKTILANGQPQAAQKTILATPGPQSAPAAQKTILAGGEPPRPAPPPVASHGASGFRPPAAAPAHAPAPAPGPPLATRPPLANNPTPAYMPGPAPGPAPQAYSGRPPSGAPPVGNQAFGAFTPGAGGPSKKKIYLAVAGAMALAVLGVVGSIVKDKVFGPKTARGAISYAALDVDNKNASVDEVIGNLESYARKRWRKDATWWSLTIYGVRPDGTVDLTADNGGGAVIKFVSTAGVQAASKRGRKDSIKEYKLTRSGVKSDKIISATKPWKGFEPLPTPCCKITDLAAAMKKAGFTDGTVRVSFDPKFGFASGWNWRVFAEGKPYEGYYSMQDCAFSKNPPK